MKIGSEWTFVGSCGVDSGQLLFTDPCYIHEFKIDEFRQNEPSGDYSYNGCCHVTTGETPAGHVGVGYDGVAVATGFGDGNYPVYVKFDGGRVMAALVVFDGVEEDGEPSGI